MFIVLAMGVFLIGGLGFVVDGTNLWFHRQSAQTAADAEHLHSHMKIALVILHADPARGGAERYTVDLAAALARRRHDVSILATSFAKCPEFVKPVELPAPGGTRVRQYRSMLDSLDRHLDNTRYDVVHAMLPVRNRASWLGPLTPRLTISR